MGRRRKSADPDAMELLLDTVSNVFGGVMFLTLLASLLVISRGGKTLDEQIKKRESSSETATDYQALQRAEQAIQLKLAIEKVRSQLAELDPHEEARSQLAYRTQLKEQLVIAESKIKDQKARSQSLQEIEQDYQQELATRSAQERALATELKTREGEVSDAEGRILRVVTFRPLKSRIGREALIMLRYGKVYLARKNQFSSELNMDDVKQVDPTGVRESILPRPDSGRSLTNLPDATNFVKKLDSNFPSDEFHVSIAVWDDSFTNYNLLKQALIETGYEYRTLPANASSSFSFGPSSGSLVQ